VNTQFTYICSEFHRKGSWRNHKATGGSMFGEKLSHYVDLPRWWIGADIDTVFSVCAPNIIPTMKFAIIITPVIDLRMVRQAN